ncbi:MAG: helix-turn-helix domain-containing protein [Patescibacteria group bacterium]|nr:helix-turn-helix domain-containing protein [Patescibacteria group bacterium]
MGFIKKSIGTDQSFGIDLKELRELRGWTVKELSKISGISEYIIEALESENFSSLNDPYYSERHVRALTKALDGRIPFILGKYRAALVRDGFEIRNTTKNYSFTHKIKRSEFFTPTKYLPFLIIIPIFFLLGYYVWNEAKIFRESPSLTVTSPADNEQITGPRIIIQGKTDPTASVVVNGIFAVVEEDGSFALNMDIPRGLTKLDIIAKRRYGLESKLTRYITYAPIQGPAPPNETIRYFQDYSTTTESFATSTIN